MCMDPEIESETKVPLVKVAHRVSRLNTRSAPVKIRRSLVIIISVTLLIIFDPDRVCVVLV